MLKNREDLGKFDAKSDESIFIGYSLNSATYRVYNKRTRSIFESRYVDFSETEMYSGASTSTSSPIFPEMNTSTPPSTTIPTGLFASDFVDLVEFDLMTPVALTVRETSSGTVEPEPVLSPIVEAESSSNIVNEETDFSPSWLSTSQHSPETAIETVQEQTESPVLAPIPEVVPPSSPSITYAEVVREPRLEILLEIDPSDHLQSSVVHDANDARNNMEYDPLPHSRKWTRSHSTINIIGSPSTPVKTRSSKGNENDILFGGFLSDFEPTKTQDALSDPDWVRDENDLIIRNKSHLVAKGYRQQEGIDYDKTFAHVARIEAIRIFLAYAAYKNVKAFQMYVKCAFLNEEIQEEVYIEQLEGFVDPKYSEHVYVLDKAPYGLKQAPRAWYETLTIYLLESRYQKDTIDPTLFLKRSDVSGNPVDQKNYCAIIGSLLYLTASRPDILFATGVCARFQCDPREPHLGAVKRILKYLKGTPNFGLRYPKDSGFELTAFTDSDHAGCKLNRKSTSGVCQFLGDKLVLWMKTQLADYGYTMHQIPIYYDSSSAIQIAENPVQHSRMKHIDIRYHFIKDHVEKVRRRVFA
ncbi:hypothetical protein OSB04_024680 [Centaurea solstitialis]|uniref:Reverse transcriptase Ty1/copia-type domain-containing protein n=1 Tax=Centaurea solstitialis TaxID=347529 RepID=A0AA38T621_9ASTR|nr:hypothetical protein OSB04_024680 [Centaurea solstitialis]